MADKINVGRLVAEIVLEAETEKAKQEVTESAKDIKDELKSIGGTTADVKVDVKADTQKAISEVKESTDTMAHYLKNNLNSVIDKDAYVNLLKDLTAPSKPVEVPVTLQVEETNNEDMLEKIKVRLVEIGVETSNVDKVMQECFGDISTYSSYEKQLNIIATKLDIQREKVSKLQKEQQKLAQTDSNSEKHLKQLEKVTQACTAEEVKLKQLENQFDKTIISQENYVDKKVSAYQKGVDAAENAAKKEIVVAQKSAEKQNALADKINKNDDNLVNTQVVTSLRAIGNIAPGASSGIADVVEQLTQLKEIMNALPNGASAGLATASIAVGLVSTIIVSAVNVYQKFIEKQEEARQKAIEAAQEYKDTSVNIEELTNSYIGLKTKLDANILSTTEQIDAKNNLCEIEDQLIETLGEEATGIDLVNGKIDEQIEKINEWQKAQAIKYTIENEGNYERALYKLKETKTYAIGDFSSLEGTDVGDEIIKHLEEVYGAKEIAEGWGVELSLENANSEIQSILDYLMRLNAEGKLTGEVWNQIYNTIGQTFTAIPTDEISNYQDQVNSYEDALDIVNGKANETNESLYEIYNNSYNAITENISAVENLASAYETLKNGEQIDTATLLELCDLYPELAQYIAETGDMSLDSGEKLKEAQKTMLESSMSTLSSQITSLKLKEDKTDEEIDLLNRMSGAYEVYKGKLEELGGTEIILFSNSALEEFQTVIDDLSGAYTTLADGKDLDYEQTIDLIQKYPELSQVLMDGTKSIGDQKSAIESLLEAKKNKTIQSLELDKTELESTISKTEQEIAKYDELIQSTSMWGAITSQYKDEQSALEDELINQQGQLDGINAKLNAIKNVSGETLENAEKSTKSTSETNEVLQEQLALINHRKAMNDLTYGEEISWLQLLYTQYATNAEERMSLDEKIYTAQQNLIKEQEQAYSDLYNTEITNLEHLKALDQLSKEQELTWLNTIYSTYVLTAEERMSLEEKIYSVQKEIQDEQEQAIKDAMQSELDLLEHEKSMDRLSAEDEIKWLERIDSQYEMSIEDRRSMELKLYNARKAHEEEIQKAQQETLDKAINSLESRRKVSRITYEEEIKELREIYNTYKLTTEQQQQVLEQIRSLSRSAKSERSSQFETLGDGVVEALKNKYQEQRDLEEERINESIESWQKWEDETVSAIQSQIDALDELADAQESEKERQEYENKRQATELQLAYEKDDYNRKQLQKELARLDNEENERLAEEQRKQQKEELQAQIDSVKEQSQSQQDLLQAELDAVAENYEKLMSSYSLENEAYEMMLSQSQSEIIAFIGSYAPEYELMGQTLGEKLYIGLKNKISNIDYYFQQMQVKWQSYSNRTAAVANQAVDQFWASRAEYESKINSMATTPNVNLTVNFNEQVESPVEVARKMEQVTQNLVTQLKQ